MRTPRGLTLLEIVAVIGILAVVASLLLPTLAFRRREGGPRSQCQSNIRQILSAMNLYADTPSNGGFFPTLSTSREDPFRQSQTSSEALNLLYRQYVSDPRIFACPNDPSKPTPQNLQQIKGWPTDGSKIDLRMTPAHTSYAYDPGHCTKTSSMVALISDKPGANGNSHNHGPGAGQNLGFGTSVEFRETLKNPLGDGAADNNIFTLGDVTKGDGPGVMRDEDSYIRK